MAQRARRLGRGGSGVKRLTRDANRGTAASRGYGHRWRVFCRSWLAANPLCVHCLKDGRPTIAKIVDHIIPHRGDPELFWRPGNHQSLCKFHHDKKTAAGE